jgi:hypothetical protein
MDSHLANLRLALERMHRFGLKMNQLKCVFGVSASKFLGFIIHEHQGKIISGWRSHLEDDFSYRV